MLGPYSARPHWARPPNVTSPSAAPAPLERASIGKACGKRFAHGDKLRLGERTVGRGAQPDGKAEALHELRRGDIGEANAEVGARGGVPLCGPFVRQRGVRERAENVPILDVAQGVEEERQRVEV